ncbi:MAG: hypothetical protein KME17_06135 [Cyanosarcina radialis HA8281-LM2]|nr:hypothetical protein [Cyanosarcina radialis HA8281-LM2]
MSLCLHDNSYRFAGIPATPKLPVGAQCIAPLPKTCYFTQAVLTAALANKVCLRGLKHK